MDRTRGCKLRSVGVTPDNREILSDLSALVGGAQGILCLVMNQLLQEGPFFDPVFTPEWQELLMLLRRKTPRAARARIKDEFGALQCPSDHPTLLSWQKIWDTYVRKMSRPDLQGMPQTTEIVPWKRQHPHELFPITLHRLRSAHQDGEQKSKKD